jgi:hypothetical protein
MMNSEPGLPRGRDSMDPMMGKRGKPGGKVLDSLRCLVKIIR